MLEFFIAALVIGIAPGPDNLFVLAQSATYGARLGFCIILGLCTGIALQICLLVAGVSALIAASPTAFFVIQCLGAAYLLYLAYKSFGVRAGVVQLDERRETSRLQVECRDDEFTHRHDRNAAPDAEGVKDERSKQTVIPDSVPGSVVYGKKQAPELVRGDNASLTLSSRTPFRDQLFNRHRLFMETTRVGFRLLFVFLIKAIIESLRQKR